MTSTSPAAGTTAVAPAGRRPWVAVAWLAWTAFVWVGRVRNALADPALDAGGRVGPLLLSLSFLVPAVVLAVWLARSWGRPAGRGLRLAVGAFAGWTVGVWVLRVADILLGGDHPAGFVVVHAVLGLVSIALAAAAARAMSGPARSGPVPPGTAEHGSESRGPKLL